MLELNAFLLWLICVGISAIAIGYFIKYYNNPSNEGFIVYTCPSNTREYINNDGESNCCNGEIVNGRCTGNNVCSLSPTNNLKLPSCGDYLTALARSAESEYCFPDIPNYFASANANLRGCSTSTITPDGTAPSDPELLQCILYQTAALDEIKLDSCYNYKKNKAALSGANCPGATGVATGTARSAATGAAAGAAANTAASMATGASSLFSSVRQQASTGAQGASSALGSLFGSRAARSS